ncbi:MAG: hypothetical protein ACXABG_13270 [Promethearchaeota archaeon]|jgi:hypothetical protein
MSFKELNLNKGFNKPKLEPKDHKSDVNIQRAIPKTGIERQASKINIDSKSKIERKRVSTVSRNKIEKSKVCTISKNKIERPKVRFDQNKKFKQLKNAKIENPKIQKNKINPKKRYRTKPKAFNLDGYVKRVVDNWLYNIRKRQTQLRLDYGKQHVYAKDRNFVKVYNHRRFYNYAGLVYRIIEKTTGKIRYGSTLGTLEDRWSWYKKDALKNSNDPNVTPFHRRILEFIRLGRNPDNEFIVRPVDICFDVNTLAMREDYWIKKHKTQHPSKGYNIKGGGVGIKLDVPISKVVSGIACGYNIEDIRKSLSSSMGLNFSRKTVSRRVKHYWGGKKEARRCFLKPVLEKIIKDGYKTNDIIQSFGKHGRNIVERAIPQLFEYKTFSEIRRNYLKQDLIKFIKMGLGPKAIDKQMQNHSLTEINNTIKEEWGSLDLAQKFLWKDLIISKIRNGEHPNRFLKEFGYSENSAKSQYNRVLQRLFNGMTYKQIKEKINNSNNSNYF